jgi:hypothetical protein
MKRHTTTRLCLALAATMATAMPAHAQQGGAAPQKKLYCWNENGRKVCGDALPAEQAANARTEISARSGRALTRVDRTLTGQERSAAEAQARDAQLAADGERARIRRDLAMVESYATENDLRRAFNERIVLVDEGIKTSVLGEANLRLGLVGLLTQAANLELNGKPVAKPLHDGILKQRAELTRQLQVLAAQRTERATLDGDLASALQRYRDLKSEAANDADVPPASDQTPLPEAPSPPR